MQLQVQAPLVDDRVDGDRRLAGLAVADDQLPLAPPDGDQRVDGLDAGLHRLVHRLATGDARGLDLHAAPGDAGERALAVDRLAQGVDHPAQQAVADRHVEDAAGGPHHLALFDVGHLAEHDRADRLLVEVEGQAQGAVLELEHLVHRRVGQARHPGDAVADLDDPADLRLLMLGLEALRSSGWRRRCLPCRCSARPCPDRLPLVRHASVIVRSWSVPARGSERQGSWPEAWHAAAGDGE